MIELKPVLFAGDTADLENRRALKAAWKAASRAASSACAALTVVKGEAFGVFGPPQPSRIPEAESAYTAALEALGAAAAQARAYGLR